MPFITLTQLNKLIFSINNKKYTNWTVNLILDELKETNLNEIDILKNEIEMYIIMTSNLIRGRRINFPETISENLTRLILKYRGYDKIQSCKEHGKFGDLFMGKLKFEIKCFTSLGPSSFGPNEKWDHIFFLDATDYVNMKFKLYHIPLSNENKLWKNLKVNKYETIEDQNYKQRRPRLKFSDIKKQLSSKYIIEIFNDYIDHIIPKEILFID